MSKKVRFILNPKAGRGLNNKITSVMLKILSPHLFDYEILFTKSANHAIELSKQAAANNYEIVVAVGGDGTVNEVAQSLVNSQTSLAIIPTGSGNGLARHFKIPLDIEKAIGVIKEGKETVIDSLLINNKFCLNIAGTGFDGHIAHLFADYGKRGLSSYIKLVIKEYFSFKEKNYTIEYDNTIINCNAFLISIANASQFGNNARIASAALPNDGMIDLVILKKIPLGEILFTLQRIFAGRMTHSRYAQTIRSESFTITCNEEMVSHLDGEPSDSSKTIHATILKNSIKLIVP
jgi:diacylglycerol kinase (ATP)